MTRIEEMCNKSFTNKATSHKISNKNIKRVNSLTKIPSQSNNLQIISISKIKKNSTILFEKNIIGIE